MNTCRRCLKPVPPGAHTCKPASIEKFLELAADAERWRALMGSARLSILGTAGSGHTMHIGLEIWGRYPIKQRNPAASDEARKLLTKYADDRRREGHV